MAYSEDFSTASSSQIEEALSQQIARLRLARNMTQHQLAVAAGIGVRTLKRLEAGQSVSLNTFIRVLMGLGIHENLVALIPDPLVRPLERVRSGGRERRRARPRRENDQEEPWTWAERENSRRGQP